MGLCDLIFPPLCRNCKELSRTKFLCLDCWRLCEIVDPLTQCRHCFDDLDQRGNLCGTCRKNPAAFIRAFVFDKESPAHFLDIDLHLALAGFGYLQWIQLDWETPDLIIPFPRAKEVTRHLAHLLEAPYKKALLPDGTVIEEWIGEEQNLLLVDLCSPKDFIEKSICSLLETFPKRIYMLSFFHAYYHW